LSTALTQTGSESRGAAVAPSHRTRVAYLNQAGHDAGGAERTLATFLAQHPRDLMPSAILFEDGAFADELRSLDVDVHVIGAPKRLMRAKRERIGVGAVLAVPRLVLAVASALRRAKIDVIYTNSMKAHVIGALAGRLIGVPCIMHFHDLIQGRGLRLLRIAARYGSARRIACSQLVASAIGVAPTTVIYGPIELARYDALPSRTEARRLLGIDLALPTVALVGRINRWKGHDRFVRIADLVNRERRANFLIVGSAMFRDAEFVPELHAMVRDRHLEQIVHFIPWVDDVRTVYAAIDVNVNCSTREPLGRSPAEAAAAGKPSVVFDDSGVAETLVNGPASRIVPAGDEAAFARAIVALLADAPLDEKTTATIRQTAGRFAAGPIAEQTAGVIRSVVRA